MSLSRRSSWTTDELIERIFSLGRERPDVINLSIGLPNGSPAKSVYEGAAAAIARGVDLYTPPDGIVALRERVAKLLKEAGVPTAEVMITPGVSAGIVLSLLATCDPGDEILLPDPYFVSYRRLPALLGVRVRTLSTSPSFHLSGAAIRRAAGSRTRAIVLTSPGNPTGKVYSSSELSQAAAAAGDLGLVVISDETYRDFCFEPPFVSIAQHYPRTLILGGLSKSHCMSGWRVGYAAGPAELIRRMTSLQRYISVCAPAVSQHAALVALEGELPVPAYTLSRRRDILYSGLSQSLRIVRPDGGLYMFPEAPAGLSGTQFTLNAIERGVLVLPGAVFSEQDTHFRVSFAATEEELSEAIERLRPILSMH